MNLEHRSGDGPVVYNVVNYHSNIQIGKINTETDILPNMFLFESQTFTRIISYVAFGLRHLTCFKIFICGL